MKMTRKLYSAQALASHLKRLKKRGTKIVFTNGCFDILHAGHVMYLEKARAQGDFLVVGLNSDASVRRLKGKGRPVNTERDRARVLGGLSSVDAVTFFSEETPLHLIEAIKPDVLVKGSDWRERDIAGAKQVRSWNGSVKRIRLLAGRSTTKLLKSIRRTHG
jgi:rfaE bifunctional protein nucleotidyltransferase chain/domain